MTRDNRLKDLLWGKSEASISWGPQEIDLSGSISPIAKIKVVWVGGWWLNAVNRMIEWGLEWVEFIAMNTDSQALFSSLAERKLNIWKVITAGLWAWSDPEIGKKAADESSEEIKSILEGADMVFITCGLGWGTGTWAAPVVARIAKELGALTVWVVTKPFSFEGQNRMAKSLDWYTELKESVDTLITIPNDRILTIIDKKTPLLDAFGIVDEVLNQWVQWVSDLITQAGLINVDFADVKSVMTNAGSALMWIGYGSGENRAVEAARSAIDSPLLELSVGWAKWVLFNITGWTDLSMFEVDEAARIITESVDPNANIIFGATIREDYEGELKITVVAAGFDMNSNKESTANWHAASKPNPFWKKQVNDSRIYTNSPLWNNSISKNNNNWDDLDVPTFLRKKM
jgi:cell division protein FtsZ